MGGQVGHELHPNGGDSLRDAVDTANARLERLCPDPMAEDCAREGGRVDDGSVSDDTDLIRFLRRRLDEVEARARVAGALHWTAEIHHHRKTWRAQALRGPPGGRTGGQRGRGFPHCG
ncbi:hypothetical protein [Streptomyces sp. ST2-7A]|uniref:hypothetical protein n=1 Tax=Streptomyces sp. ST2-7A TaxID=2907214 RepID=UPI001F31BB7C|nr:hypothetical protein [Streptomyces sp. ST2-7A]MCE7081419.1 hypothetical protein [Streptomyces sp. ST2-7A]